MSFAVVLDASVLYPLPLRDTLLRVAETELYDPLWSARILDEVMRNLEDNRRATVEQTCHLRDAMTTAFDSAEVSRAAIDRLEPAMINDPKDRHVLAAAVASEAQAIVTLNLNDFPSDACDPFAIESLHPDVFLLQVYELDEQNLYEAVERQAAALSNPPMTVDELFDRFALTVPSFAEAIRAHAG